MTDLEIAWFAGLLEGEGWFRAYLSSQHPSWRPRLLVGLKMNDRDVVERAAALVGGKTKIRTERPREIKWSDSYRIEWNGKDAEHVMRTILPYMGQRRSAKIRECLATPNLSHYPKEDKA